jgi:RNA polymerase sigma factor (TIGR02999 family)
MSDNGMNDSGKPSPEAGFDAVTQNLYSELRSMAHRERRRAGNPQTLQTTALINEAYLKLHQSDGWSSREHFLGTAATAMRHILIDAARARMSLKRGEGVRAVELDEARDAAATSDEELIRVDEALAELAKLDPRLARVVECRFFAGYSEAETGKILGVSERTVRRDWLQAKAWLYRSLQGED